MKKILLGLLLICGIAHADTTSNLINNNNWTGIGAYAPDPNNCCSNPAGSQPLYDTSTNTIKFSYGQGTVAQAIAINNALAGSGVRIGGYNWSYDLRNMNGHGGQGGVDQIWAQTWITNSSGQYLTGTSIMYNSQFEWQTFSGTQNLNDPLDLANAGTINAWFQAKDNGFWAGLYGPEVRNVSLGLNYTVDPCVANPRYSPSCPGYNTVWDSGNLTSVYGTAFAVNQALGFGNSGVQVHSAIWGYDFSLGGQYCKTPFFGSLCLEYADSKVTGQWSVSDNNGNILFYDTSVSSGQNVSNTVRREVLIGTDISALNRTSMSTQTVGNATASNPYIGFTFRPDICTSDPLVNPSCPGYAVAYLNIQCSSNPLYDASCPRYAQAYFTQQCSANPLYSNQCPGYGVAYFNQQCSLDPLYATQCPGYDQAYFNQQCSLDGLYSNQCPNYAEAYALANIVTITPTTTPTTVTTTEVAVVSDPVVNDVITTTSTSTTSPTATVQLTTSAAPTITNVATVEATASKETKEETKDASTSSVSETTTASTSSSSSESKTEKPTARQELAAKRREAAKQAAIKAGTKAAEEVGTATSMEAQVAVQNVVIAAMGFTPGFQAYNVIMPDGVGYKPFTVYKNQVNVDNRRLSRGLNGPSDVLHEKMVAMQWELK